jgi:tellurite resistance protein TehA-like permease
MGSSGFLLIFAAVNFANFRLYRQTCSNRWISLFGTIACIAAVTVLLHQTAQTEPKNLWVVVVMVGLAFAIEVSYRQLTNRHIHLYHPQASDDGG